MKIRCVALWHLNNLGEWLILRISLANPGGEREIANNVWLLSYLDEIS